MPVTTAIIVAAGSGTRMGQGVDKLFLEVGGRPVVAHTWQRLDELALIDDIIIVVRPDQEGLFQHLARRWNFKKPWRLVRGGKERQDSVWNGLQALPSATDADMVAIHDAARPCTNPAVIAATIEAARTHGAAVAAQRTADTIKESEDGTFISRHPDRSRLWAVQTPQCFRVPLIKRALQLVFERGLRITDDTAACELIGAPVRLVENTMPNPKVTIPDDLPYVEFLLRRAGWSK